MVEDFEMWTEFKKTGSLTIRGQLVEKYIPLVKYVVGKIAGNLPNYVDYNDLVEYGIIGLLDAVDKYDVTKNINFKTYAVTRVRGSVYDELRVQDWVPRSVRKMAKDIEKANVELEKKLKRLPREAEIAEHLNVTPKEIDAVFAKVNIGHISSLDDIIYGSDDSTTSRGETIENKKSGNAHEKLEKDELKTALMERLKELSEKERMIISLYYYEELTLKEIGSILGISESRVSQIHSKAVLKLRSKLSAKFGEYKGII